MPLARNFFVEGLFIMVFVFLKWLVRLPISFLSTIAAWVVSPLCPLFAHNYSLRGTRFWWTTTPNCDLRGDPDHQARFHYKNSYWQQVWWVIRNPGVNFQREHLGVSVVKTDTRKRVGNPKAQDIGGWFFDRIYRDGKVIAWMLFVYLPYPFKKDRAFRMLLGWKTWDFLVKNPLQITGLIQPWKTFK